MISASERDRRREGGGRGTARLSNGAGGRREAVGVGTKDSGAEEKCDERSGSVVAAVDGGRFGEAEEEAVAKSEKDESCWGFRMNARRSQRS